MPAQTRRRWQPHAVRGIGRRLLRTRPIVLPSGDVYVFQSGRGSREYRLRAEELWWNAFAAADVVWTNVWTDRLYFLLPLEPSAAACLPPGRQRQ